ncbi:AAA family ATPase [Mucilaginibacter sp. L196]|jgi:AAA15 family ATPase/GTPase|uniref:AAA family ATPase n=1 Tax=Mucilaginibacter sp. L196 TaxID=1641870 RepID=UPI00131E1B9F|nr:AAA family ATPase [Mucilaginibacter sp. L196]
MITKIEVDGFKSLSQFELKLNSGLNILVGPNGAGKTNIILFFEFISKMVRNPIAHAVSSVGGAGAIFKKLKVVEYQDTISFKIYGALQQEKNSFLVYEISAIIKSSFEKDDIYFSRQEVKVRTATKFWKDPDDIRGKTVWDFNLEYNYQGEKPELIIHELNKKKFKPRYILNSTNNEAEIEKAFKDFILKNDPSTQIIISALFPIIEHTHIIVNDILGGESFNVVPSKVKEQEDAAKPPGIKKDGSGLSTTLYALKKSKPVSQSDFIYYYMIERIQTDYDPKTLSKIISYLKLANKTVVNLDVENDPFDNKLIVKIFIKTGNYEAVLPLSSMSDGTIKWLTLITAILTSKTIFSIEEPENFLHPWMQAEIVNIMREHIDSKNNQSFVIMTTHSESLLNHSNAEEIILVDLIEGKTVAKKIPNIDLLKSEISQTGMGLGSFYFSNSFGNE